VLTTEELVALGLTPNVIAERCATGLLHRRYHGVFAVGRPELSFEGECLAGVRACGPGTGVFGITAGALWGIRESSGVLHVAAPRQRRYRQRGLVIHRPRCLHPDAITTHRGVPVTTVARTLLDLAASVPRNQVGWAMNEAAVQRIFDPAAVLRELERNPRHRGRRPLGQLLEDEVAPTRSGLERAGQALVRPLRLGFAEFNHEVWTDRNEEVDVCWPELRLIVEWDGGRYHSTRWRQRRDAEKTARLEGAGWSVLRFSDLEVSLDSRGVAARILAAANSGRQISSPR